VITPHHHANDGGHAHGRGHVHPHGRKQAQTDGVGQQHGALGGLEVAVAHEQHGRQGQGEHTPHKLGVPHPEKGRWSSSRSRRVPPPKAATKDTTHTPTTSNRLRAAAMMPESAKAAVAAI
jgi:hypothetical protein